MSIAVRSQNSAGLLSAIRTAVADVDRTVPVYNVKGMEEMVARVGIAATFRYVVDRGFRCTGVSFGGGGHLRSYGVLGFAAHSEIEIRIALGAPRGSVLRLLLSQGAKLAFAGVVVGIFGGFALTRLMASLLLG